MDDDLTLFDPPHKFVYEPEPLTKAERLKKMVRRDNLQTSYQAAEKALPKLTKTKQKIINLLAGYPEGLTSSEVARLLDMDKGSSSKRLGDLENEKYLIIDGTRLSDRKRQSSIYKINPSLTLHQ